MYPGKRLALILVLLASLAVSASAQTGSNDKNLVIPEELASGNETAGDVDAQYKFDDGFYQKIQGLIQEESQKGDFEAHDGERYYNVIMVVSRDDGDGGDPDQTARENKDSIVRYLNQLGARDILAAESLSFVTASIPVDQIPELSMHEEIYKMGDGELPVTPEVDIARYTIYATPLDLSLATGWVPDGDGVTVAVVDTGIDSIHLNDKVADRAYCNTWCVEQPDGIVIGEDNTSPDDYDTIFASHGTQVAQIIAASGMPTDNGIAPGVTLLDAMYGQESGSSNFLDSLAHALDWSHSRGADVVNISAGIGHCSSIDTTTYSLIINEAVDKGMVVVKSAGNEGLSELGTPSYRSISNPGCAHNGIVVGGVDDRITGLTKMYDYSSRGPESNLEPRLMPHIVAPATDIQTLVYSDIITFTTAGSGTSLSAPQVSAAAAMMLQAAPDLTPAEVKAGLLLGADWQGPIPCTSVMYEFGGYGDCSYTMQPTDFDVANNAASLGILNNVGFGILNAAESIRYASSSAPHIVSDHLESDLASRQYQFVVTDTTEPVKIMLTWMAHPHRGIAEQRYYTGSVPVADLDFKLTLPNGELMYASSHYQTTEFIVFYPTMTGIHTVSVYSYDGVDWINKPVQTFALASTVPFIDDSNHYPVALSRTITVSPAMETAVILSAYDIDGDAVSFHISQDPRKGVITTDELITKYASRAVYTPDDDFAGIDTFQVTPHDGKVSGVPATITIQAESLPPGSYDTVASTANVRDWHVYRVSDEFVHREYTQGFATKGYPVSALYMRSTNLEGADLTIITTDGDEYIAAVPPSGVRRIELPSPIVIRDVTLSADGIGEEVANYGYALMSVGYVPSACTMSGAAGFACPAQQAYVITTEPGLSIPDDAGVYTSSTIDVFADGIMTALSVSVDIDHARIGDLELILTAPDGTEVTLHDGSGGSGNDIKATYGSSTNAALRTLTGSSTYGSWTLWARDHSSGVTGVLNSWSLGATYDPYYNEPIPVPAMPFTVLADDFESSSALAKWAETSGDGWRASTSQAQHVPAIPGRTASDTVLHADDCDEQCIITLRDPIDLTGYSQAILSFWRFVDPSLDEGEYLRVELYDGSGWNTIYDWSQGDGGDNTWHAESYDLASYLGVSDFKIRFVTQQSSGSEDVQIDDILIGATSDGVVLATPDIRLDREVYTWTDEVHITIVAPDHNFDDSTVEEIGADHDVDSISIATGHSELERYRLIETGADTGIFEGQITLTGFVTHDADGDGLTYDALGITSGTGAGPTDGLLASDGEDEITVSFEYADGRMAVGSAQIRWNIAEVEWLEASYPATGVGTVRIVDPDMNLNPLFLDLFEISVTSDSDPLGIDLLVFETVGTPGVFEGTVEFVAGASLGHLLQVAEGDTIYAEYTDHTLPNPYSPSDELVITATVTSEQGEPLQAPDIDIEVIPGILATVQPDIGAGNTITATTGATKGTITEGFLTSGTIAYTANAGESGMDTVNYTASDGDGNVARGTVYFYISEQGNERPSLEAMPGMQTQASSIITFWATASDGNDDPLTYDIRNAPDGATIHPRGIFKWTPTTSDIGDHVFDIIVHDDLGGLDVQKVAITVSDPGNDSPTAPAVHHRTTSDTPVLVTPDIRDPEGQPTGMILAVGADKGAIREGFLEANIIAYIPEEEGTDIISYTTTDGAGGAATGTVYIHTGTSADPDLEAIGVRRVETPATLTFQASATDADSTDVSYIMSGAPAGATIGRSTGAFSWTPATTDAGDHTFTITAYDGQGGFDTEPVAISVSEQGVTNRDPNITDFDSATRQNNPKFIALETSDPDGDPTDIILATGATTGTIRQNLLQFGIITYVPETDWTGTDTVTYVVSDGRGGASTGTIHIHVRDLANDEPVLDHVGNRQVSVPDTLTFDASAFDNEGDPLTYAIRNAPAGATMTPDGTFSWTPAASDTGDHEFTVAVHDDAGGFATERIIVTVTDPTSTNQNPTTPDESVTTAGDQIAVLPSIADPDGDDIAIIAVTGAIKGIVDPKLLDDAIIAYTPFEGELGVDTIAYTVSDGRGGRATGVTTITITEPTVQNIVSVPNGAGSPGCEEDNLCFVPSGIVVDTGDEVTWVNDDSVIHSITVLDGDGPVAFDSGFFGAGESFTYRFDVAGEYHYRDLVHPWMAGTVTVTTAELPTQAAVMIPTGSGSSYCDEDDLCFVPSELTIKAGGAVTWVNDDHVLHNVVVLEGDGPVAFDSGFLGTGESFTYRFNVPGGYHYQCYIHPWMTGTVTVAPD